MLGGQYRSDDDRKYEHGADGGRCRAREDLAVVQRVIRQRGTPRVQPTASISQEARE